MKKLLSFAAACLFAVAVVSCGQKTENQTSEEAPATEQQDVQADTTTVVTPADSVQN